MDDRDIKNVIRWFLINDLHIKPSNIDKIDICRMVDGQLRNINISFIPSLYKGENTND